MSIVIAIETSCDETAISIVEKRGNSLKVLAQEISSQVALHAKWGGVVPNLAAREHVKNIAPLFELVAKDIVLPQKIDLIAVTQGPGLIPALLVGTTFAKNLAYLWDKPLIGIHHIEGHIYANFVSDNISEMTNSQISISKQDESIISDKISKISNDQLLISKVKERTIEKASSSKLEAESSIKFPALVLVVSGGHTQLVLMKDHFQYEIIGQTLDDAAGEAFDKVARILEIGYPGGPAISAMAEIVRDKGQETRDKEKQSMSHVTCHMSQIKLPRPMLNKKNFDFSFSGLKTAVLYETKKNAHLLKDKNYLAAVCHEFQQAVVDVLVQKTIRAAEKYKPKTVMLAGGVSANKELRQQMKIAIEQSIPDTCYLTPDTSLTGDNAAMIGIAAAFRWDKMTDAQKKKARDGWKTIQPDANLKLK